MTLHVNVDSRAGTFRLSARFDSAGGVTAIFGASGAGKTTLVNLIAGLATPERGTISIDGDALFDSDRGINLPASRRRIGYVFQDGRLFPHYSVRGNLLYGARRAGRGSNPPDFEAVVDLLGVGALLDRQPAGLSGGEKQRIALGRALLAGPRLILMDEPLASLDGPRKAEILPYIERLRDQMRLPIVYVTHDLDEVARLADALILLADGKVVASGAVNDVLARADLRQYTGIAEASVVLAARIVASDPDAGTILDHPAGRLSLPFGAGAPDIIVRLRVRARDVALAVGEPGRLSIRNRLAATVVAISETLPPMVEVRMDVGGQPLLATITPAALADLDLKPGQPVIALIKSASFDRPSGGGLPAG